MGHVASAEMPEVKERMAWRPGDVEAGDQPVTTFFLLQSPNFLRRSPKRVMVLVTSLFSNSNED